MSGLDVHIARKTYPNGLETLRELRLQAAPGEFVAIVGPSGAGKSTLLNIIAGLDRDFEGRLTHPPHWRAGLQASPVGFMFQEPRLMPWLSVRDNIALVLSHPQQAGDAIEALLQTMGLRDFAQAYPNQLSGGMRRRAALARAFVGQPALLLMDEPFTSLDAPTATGLRQLLWDQWRAHQPTILFVTHQLTEALALADRVVFLSDRPARVIHEYRPRSSATLNARTMDLAAHQPEADQLLRRHPHLLHGVRGD